MLKNFFIKDLFEVINNPQLDKENFTFSESAEYPYFTRTENNNGILGYVEYLDEEHKIKGNSLAVGMISMRFGFNEKLAMYFIGILNKHSEYYQSFLVRHFKDKVSETVVALPVIESPVPNHEYTINDIDWQSIQSSITKLEQDYIAEIERERIAELDAYLVASGLDDYELTDEDKRVLAASKVMELGKFSLGGGAGLFNIYSPKKRFNANTVQFGGKYPYVARGSSNNGIRGFITEDEQYLSPAKSLSFGQDTATVYYQPDAYFTGDKIKVMVLNNRELTPELAEYFIAAIAKAFSNFAWGQNSFNESIIKSTEIVLPVKSDGTPDFDYMERYIRAVEKLAIADVVRYKDRMIAAAKQVVNT